MGALVAEMSAKALRLGIPLSVQLDLTYRCNERCVHCYLDHDDHGEMTTSEIKNLLDEMAAAGVFFLTISGGEILMRRDFFEILEHAHARTFCIKLKTNGIMIREADAARIRALGVESVQISVYSHRPEIHDAITKVPGSLQRSIDAIRLLREQGIHVDMANVLMIHNVRDYPGVKALAAELGAQFIIDPTITPMMDGDRSILGLNVDEAALCEIFHDEGIAGNVAELCAAPQGPGEDDLNSLPCSAGHTACYVSPYGDVYPCVQFPLPSGNVRRTKFLDIWRHSPQLNEVRSIRLRDMPSCSQCVHGGTCTRCPGLAYLEGNMRGPSSQDCEKSYARTGVPSENLKRRKTSSQALQLVQIQGLEHRLNSRQFPAIN
ncbi:MAG TPA: radical SAM protein [Candidatus Sulfotelmatobacter sp.]|jgi:AdoMet-dependent heme synthase|nr:radical SAM protein [Candidatus Sulfotelmatobacter sp.]